MQYHAQAERLKRSVETEKNTKIKASTSIRLIRLCLRFPSWEVEGDKGEGGGGIGGDIGEGEGEGRGMGEGVTWHIWSPYFRSDK